MAIVGDTSSRHDTICSVPNQASHEAKYGDGRVEGPYPNGRDRLIVALAKFGLEPCDVPPTISFFKGVRVGPDGNLHLDSCPGPSSRHVELRAELDVFLSLVNVPHVLDRRAGYVCTPLRVTAWRGKPTEKDDPIRTSTPEVARAYLNTDDWLLGEDR
jgi:uncharacterized protein YcgI (DUF1989 family)